MIIRWVKARCPLCNAERKIRSVNGVMDEAYCQFTDKHPRKKVAKYKEVE